MITSLDAKYNEIKKLERISKYFCGFAIFTFGTINVAVFVWRRWFAEVKNKNIDKAVEITALVVTALMLCGDCINAYCIKNKQKILHNTIQENCNSDELSQDLKRFKENFSSQTKTEKYAGHLYVTSSVLALATEVLVVTQLFCDVGFDNAHGKLPINAENLLYLICCLCTFIAAILLLRSDKKSQTQDQSDTKSHLTYCVVGIAMLAICSRILQGLESTGYMHMPEYADGKLSFGYLLASVVCLLDFVLYIHQNCKQDSFVKDAKINHHQLSKAV